MQGTQLNGLACMQEEQKFLQQRVETLQKELEMYAERSKHEVEQLKSELNSTQEVCISLSFVHHSMTLPDYHIIYKQDVTECKFFDLYMQDHLACG